VNLSVVHFASLSEFQRRILADRVTDCKVFGKKVSWPFRCYVPVDCSRNWPLFSI